MREYDVIGRHDLDEVVRAVNDLDDDWECQGGISVLGKPDDATLYLQAMVRDTDSLPTRMCPVCGCYECTCTGKEVLYEVSFKKPGADRGVNSEPHPVSRLLWQIEHWCARGYTISIEEATR